MEADYETKVTVDGNFVWLMDTVRNKLAATTGSASTVLMDSLRDLTQLPQTS